MAGCPKCDGRWPDEWYRIAELPTPVAYLNEEDVTRGARALADEFSPVKMNYERLGNQVAHIHWYLVPRLPGDPVPKMPVWVHDHARHVLADGERADRIARLRRRLGA